MFQIDSPGWGASRDVARLPVEMGYSCDSCAFSFFGASALAISNYGNGHGCGLSFAPSGDASCVSRIFSSRNPWRSPRARSTQPHGVTSSCWLRLVMTAKSGCMTVPRTGELGKNCWKLGGNEVQKLRLCGKDWTQREASDAGRVFGNSLQQPLIKQSYRGFKKSKPRLAILEWEHACECRCFKLDAKVLNTF